MKRVATAAVLIPLVLILVFRAPDWLMPLVLAGLALGCMVEYVHLAEAKGIRIRSRLLYLITILPFLLPFTFSLLLGVPLVDIAVFVAVAVPLLAPFCLVIAHMSSDLEGCLVSAGVSTLGFFYICVSLVSLWVLWEKDYGSLLVLFLLVVVWSGDISAYYVGKSLGRKKLAPLVSPGKTWEGAIASFVVSVSIGAWILVSFDSLHSWLLSRALVLPVGSGISSSSISYFPWWFAVVAAAAVNVAAQSGDLIESAMKRSANVKDSGAVLPGHGGILDRVDALLMASPVAMLVFQFGKIFSPMD